MYFEAHLDLFAIARLIQDAIPGRLLLGKCDINHHWIELATPTCVEVSEERGVLIETLARVHHAWSGREPEMHIRKISLLLSPAVASDENGQELLRTDNVEDAALTYVADLVEVGTVGLVHSALVPTNTNMNCAFGDTLRVSFPFSVHLEPLLGYALQASGGSSGVHADHFRLRIAIEAVASHLTENVEYDAASSRNPLTLSGEAGKKALRLLSLAETAVSSGDDYAHP